MRRLWLKFLGGMLAFGIIMFLVLLGFLKLMEYFEARIFLGDIPYWLRLGLSMFFIAIMIFVLHWTAGDAYRQLREIRKQRREARKESDVSSQ